MATARAYYAPSNRSFAPGYGQVSIWRDGGGPETRLSLKMTRRLEGDTIIRQRPIISSFFSVRYVKENNKPMGTDLPLQHWQPTCPPPVNSAYIQEIDEWGEEKASLSFGVSNSSQWSCQALPNTSTIICHQLFQNFSSPELRYLLLLAKPAKYATEQSSDLIRQCHRPCLGYPSTVTGHRDLSRVRCQLLRRNNYTKGVDIKECSTNSFSLNDGQRLLTSHQRLSPAQLAPDIGILSYFLCLKDGRVRPSRRTSPMRRNTVSGVFLKAWPPPSRHRICTSSGRIYKSAR
ncbi:uncharacterized protein LACBIDRAFT_299309 [Laccaria bicolor S238N-H82]|uniref:Predicted protein n=1 Tax=Laccaria bicolor (strain S238N-H82 / ATCC MYA-4686) TaxID=486041 RepID=B0DEG4_LACBS|nr:uncharacterized protein LACBIDRAFT_299309 [Laccaria bicolor S238N-H82]EDR07029.1 predicted protein [Laccaria bicolor S238N-H82]|eukprot:XP_001882402.1 predicted protein [Laccaria bicolor S238N-H82]